MPIRKSSRPASQQHKVSLPTTPVAGVGRPGPAVAASSRPGTVQRSLHVCLLLLSQPHCLILTFSLPQPDSLIPYFLSMYQPLPLSNILLCCLIPSLAFSLTVYYFLLILTVSSSLCRRLSLTLFISYPCCLSLSASSCSAVSLAHSLSQSSIAVTHTLYHRMLCE